MNTGELKRAMLELLRNDLEFRRAVAAEIGLLEILERLEELGRQILENTKAIRALQEQVAKMQEQMVKLQEQARSMQEELRRFGDRLAALGARWGLYAEEAVREALHRILQDYLGVARVEKWVGRDSEGFVFGLPALIEVDVVVKNDTHYLIEVKSSLDKYDVYVFHRKCEFYVRNIKPRKVKKLIVTFYAEQDAVKEAKALGIEVVKG